MYYLRLVAITVNVIALICIVDDFSWRSEFFVLLAWVLLNLIVLCSLQAKQDTCWLCLHLKRRRLEEQKRIEALEKNNQQGRENENKTLPFL